MVNIILITLMILMLFTAFQILQNKREIIRIDCECETKPAIEHEHDFGSIINNIKFWR